MKNLSIKSTVAAGVLSLAIVNVSANASCHAIKFYAGAGLDYNFYKLGNEVKDFLNTAGFSVKVDGMGLAAPLLGVKLHRNVGVEAGFSFNKKLKLSKNGNTASLRMRNMYMDVVGFVPVHKQVELLGGIGLGKLLVKSQDVADIGTVSTVDKFSWRAKVGVNYNFHPKVGLRGLVTYQNLSNKKSTEDWKIFKHLTALSLALTYTF